MSRHAEFAIVEDGAGALIIRDVGPWDRRLTVTNDVENVVARLVASGMLPPGRRLLYYDSEGDLDEIVVDAGRFMGFRPGGQASVA